MLMIAGTDFLCENIAQKRTWLPSRPQLATGIATLIIYPYYHTLSKSLNTPLIVTPLTLTQKYLVCGVVFYAALVDFTRVPRRGILPIQVIYHKIAICFYMLP